MTVKTFEKRYNAIQREANEIYAQIKPLLNRLKLLSKKCMKLYDKADSDNGLYDIFKRVIGKNSEGDEIVEMHRCTNGWETSIMFRLLDFECLMNDNNAAIDVIDTVLYNIKHTPFRKRQKKGKRTNANK